MLYSWWWQRGPRKKRPTRSGPVHFAHCWPGVSAVDLECSFAGAVVFLMVATRSSVKIVPVHFGPVLTGCFVGAGLMSQMWVCSEVSWVPDVVGLFFMVATRST